MKQPIFPIIFLAILGATASTSAAQNKQPDDVRAMAKRVMMPVVLKVPGMDKVKVVENLKYTKSDDPNVLMDIYIPPDLSENEERPAVIFLHGGAKTDYTPKDWGVYNDLGASDCRVGIRGRDLYPSARISNCFPGKSRHRCPRCRQVCAGERRQIPHR